MDAYMPLLFIDVIFIFYRNVQHKLSHIALLRKLSTHKQCDLFRYVTM